MKYFRGDLVRVLNPFKLPAKAKSDHGTVEHVSPFEQKLFVRFGSEMVVVSHDEVELINRSQNYDRRLV